MRKEQPFSDMTPWNKGVYILEHVTYAFIGYVFLVLYIAAFCD